MNHNQGRKSQGKFYHDWTLGKRVSAYAFGLQICKWFQQIGAEDAVPKMMLEKDEEFLPQAKLNLTGIIMC